MSHQRFFGNLFASLKEVREWVIAGRAEGCICPCCEQLVKVYRYKLRAEHGCFLHYLYSCNNYTGYYRDFIHKYTQFISKTYFFPKYWNMIEPIGEGYWRLTFVGRMFIEGHAESKYAFVSNDKVLKFSEEKTLFRDVFGEKFDFSEIVNIDPSKA